jgi:hypothetical protein
MLPFSLVLSLVMLVLVNVVYWRMRNVSSMLFAAAGFLPFGGCCGTMYLPTFLVNLGLVVGVAAVGQYLRAKAWSVLAATVAVTFVCYLGGALFAWRGIESLRREYPIESVADRLEYTRTTEKPVPPAAVAAGTEEANRTHRGGAIHTLHEETLRVFLDAPGFGFGRMRTVFWELGDKEPDEPVPLSVPYRSRPSPIDSEDLEPVERRSGEDVANNVHRTLMEQFLDPKNFGYVWGRNRVGGFRSHGRPRQYQKPLDTNVESVELVSLLRHDSPVVYLSDYLPRMDLLRDAPVRPLDPFEERELAQLRSGKAIVVDRRPSRVRVLGAIRAETKCTACHDQTAGELLGAFSYRLSAER